VNFSTASHPKYYTRGEFWVTLGPTTRHCNSNWIGCESHKSRFHFAGNGKCYICQTIL